ncbi:MAG: NAD-dependent epimerase/dehydratase family protein [Gammaproteobacteria bacterium]|nr:NAD-dependent epimerase/dehydratase family protein [Gammaproteobacteria bacterium]MDH4313425.1 NAD-dependent epimerase/dehydratase family protein [Gammaproteobacteria bacterium]MDH5214054.1 NAD-dependent epimerase/dehydratase family protein [Gammaproteobacteria bacterium]
MDKSRRQFVKAGLAGGAIAASAALPALAGASAKEKGSSAKSLRILMLGGTGYIGPHMVSEFLRRGHEVSLFNRGRTNEDIFPDLETLIGDRDGGLDVLKGREWDAVVDNSGYVPRHVADSARLLASAVSHYLYISTISVYESFAVANEENSPLAAMTDESVEEVTGETYGPMKALCEKRASAEIGNDRLTILRPTYICGPGDRTDRFSYWPVRTQRGGEMLWPGMPTDPIQIIDVRDLANFTVDCIEKNIFGTYNTVTPVASYTIGDLKNDAVAVSAADITAVWVSGEFLAGHELAAGSSIPIWASPVGDSKNVASVSGERARMVGLQTRPPRETCRDILSWWKTLPAERRDTMRAGLSAESEAKLLSDWHQKNI